MYNGPEFVSREVDLWAYENNVVLDFSRPGKRTDNAFIESFNSRFRQECLNQHWFLGTGQRGLTFSQGMVDILGNSQDERLTYRTLHHLR